MRGRLHVEYIDCLIRGNTPAHAGKTFDLIRDARNQTKHPRACGEDLLEGPLHLAVAETPPRMRGRRWLLILKYR